MNELLVLAWLLIPTAALLLQYYFIQKRQNLLWILPLASLAATFFIGLAAVLYAFFLILFTKVLTAEDPHQS
ncbi:hypothetical protein MKC73_00525 [[Clostridium] innocuum]|nr:hypothetical protein [[Clostridium] innocuum]